MIPIARTAARLLLVDADQRLLLVHERLDVGSLSSHWITPGGGVEAGETLVQAAVRETLEETGLTAALDEAAVPVHSDDVSFTIAGARYHQRNHYFFTRCASGLTLNSNGHTDLEKQVMLGHRWWHLDELDRSAVVREPVHAVAIVRSLLAREQDG